MVLMPVPKVTAVRLVQFSKALLPMLVIFERVEVVGAPSMVVTAEPLKVLALMVATPDPKVTVVRLPQFSKALLPRLVTVLGKAMMLPSLESLKALSPMVVIVASEGLLAKVTVIPVVLPQRSKALLPMLVTV
jgi:hypothetical protein